MFQNVIFSVNDVETKRLQISTACTTIVISVLGITLTIAFMVFNIKYRNLRLMKMSSPNINNVINVACLLLYLCPIVNSIKGLNMTSENLASLMCQVNIWLLPISSTAIYGAMLSKAWRIYKIFETAPKSKRIVIKDLRLIVYIMSMVSVDLVIILIWQLVDTTKLVRRYVYENRASMYNRNNNLELWFSAKSSYYPNSTQKFVKNNDTSLADNVMMRYAPKGLNSSSTSHLAHEYSSISVKNITYPYQLRLIYECNSNLNEVWIIILTMYKITIFMYGIYLAWLIRNVNIPSMNDSKYLLLSTYTSLVCGLGSMTLIQLLKEWPDVVQVFLTIGIVFSTSVTQCLIFIPKIRLWYKTKNDDSFKIPLSQIFLQSSLNSCHSSDKQLKNLSSESAKSSLNIEDELCELLHENSQLKNYLKEKEGVIKILEDKIKTTKSTLQQVNEQQNKLIESYRQILSNMDKLDSSLVNVLKPETRGEIRRLMSDMLISADILGIPNLFGDQLRPLLNRENPQPKELLDPTQLVAPKVKEENQINRDFYNILSSDSFLKNTPRDGSVNGQCKTHTEQLKNDLEEVEALTSRVRDSISLDLSSTRRHSSLLYEYYRQQLELARSIQSTYNIKFTNLFDAMNLMKKCFRDYCQTVHNPEYLAIETIDGFQICNEIKGNDFGRKPIMEECYEKVNKPEMNAKKDPSPWVSYELFENLKRDKKSQPNSAFTLSDQANPQANAFYSEIVKKSLTSSSSCRPSSILLEANKRPDSSNLDVVKQSATSDTLISMLTNSRVDDQSYSKPAEPPSSAFGPISGLTFPKPGIQFVDFENKQTYV